MLIFKALKDKTALFWGITTSFAALFWPAVPLQGLDIWLKTLIGLFPTNIGYPPLVILIGVYTALFVFNKKRAKLCAVKKTKTGVFASLTGVLLGACPACIPALAFFLPLSATITLSYFSWAFLLAAVIFLLFSIWKMGGFQKETENCS